jgi:hypothetical protein
MSTIRSIALVTAAPLVLAAAGIAHPHGLSRSTAADWAHLHIALLPVFPLLTVGLLVPLWHRPRLDLAGVATVVAWVSAFVYAAFYTGLDAVAGTAPASGRPHRRGAGSRGGGTRRRRSPDHARDEPHPPSTAVRLRGLVALLRDDHRLQRLAETELGRLLDHDARTGDNLLVLLSILGVSLESAESRTSLHTALMVIDAR